MNHWARMLADLPPTLQRAIARHRRISLPRRCPPAERLRRLRRALCRPVTVRAAFAVLPAADQAALQILAAHPRALLPAEVARTLGPLRPLARLIADPRPRSLAEQLLLMGWLLPRPATPRHPPRFRLAPELRRWLPAPLALVDHGRAPVADRPLAVRAAEALLLVCAHAPLPLRADGGLSVAALRRVVPLLQPLPADQAKAVCAFTWTLLLQLGLACAAASTGAPTPAAGRFLAQPPATRCATLRAAWLAAPGPDTWARPLLRDQRGIDWPCLRRRLCAWADALPPARRLAAAELFAALSAACGPLSDAHTHGFRIVDRAPWQPRRAAAIWQSALCGPLTWLGVIAWDGEDCCFRPEATDSSVPRLVWAYGEPGTLHLPAEALGPAALRLAAYAPPVCTIGDSLVVQLTPKHLAHAAAAGSSTDALRAVVEEQAGPLPPAWDTWLGLPVSVLRIAPRLLIEAETPATLADAARARSVRRYLGPRLAPGLALVEPEQLPALVEALARQGVAAAVTSPTAPAQSNNDMHPGERAALLVACAYYRQRAPTDAPLPPSAELERRLRAGLPPALDAAVDAALDDLGCADAARPAALPWDGPTAPDQQAAASAPAPDTPLRRTLRRAIAAGAAVELHYHSPDEGPSWRTVRPLELERRGELWYLRAYCTLRRAERTFRLDRIRSIGPPPGYSRG